MKIVVSTTGKSLDSNVESRFGRSTGFILFDTDTQNFGIWTIQPRHICPRGPASRPHK